MQKFLRGILAIVAICFSLNALPWGYEGHRIVIQIAMDFLSQHFHNHLVLPKLMRILNKGPDGKPTGTHIDPEMVASFADEMRSNPDFDCIKILHFVNIPKDVTSYRDYAAKNPQGDAVTAVMALGRYLKSNDISQVNQVPAFVELQQKVPMTQALALKLFIHFWGDLFQPLHLGYPEDMGGNAVDVVEQGRNTNLHSALDGILNPNITDPTNYAKDLERMEATKDTQLDLKESLYNAVDDTLKIRDAFYHFTTFVTRNVKPDPTKPPDPNAPTTVQVPVIDFAYIEHLRPLLESQLIKSGVMLAQAFQQIFTPKLTKGVNPFLPVKPTVDQCEAMF